MSLAEAIGVLVFFWVALQVLAWVLERGLVGIGLFRLGIALRKQLPVGFYRWDRANSISVGKPDTVVVFKMPLQPSDGGRPVKHVAVTDSTTRFSVGDETVDVDPFLEAYDDELGPLVVHVWEAGKIAAIGIDSRARRA